MSIVGFNFTTMHVEKKDVVKGKINISNNVSITTVEKTDLALGTAKQEGIKFTFEFVSRYEPEIGNIKIVGHVLLLDSKERTNDILSMWKKEKKVPQDVMENILNTVLSKCNIQALILSKEVNIPPPIMLPKVNVKK
ncbi:MAG: hypothetical protein ABH879_01805 [archaeon]